MIEQTKKKVCSWLSGFWGGVFLGAAVMCPVEYIYISLLVSAFLAIIFAMLARNGAHADVVKK